MKLLSAVSSAFPPAFPPAVPSPLLSATALRRALPAVATAALLLAVGVAPAQAQAASPDALPGNWLQLTLTHGTSQSRDTRGVLLLCDPPQGHSRAAEACAALTTANGDVDAVAGPGDRVCPLMYAPVTARAHGQWNGRPVEYARTFGNDCEMEALTGAVFALDDEQVPEV
ncbi:subtilase-type protease inhibitor [Streptomyces sp. NBC_01275]|uniref:SSI family serine proteinase inhibitor n=1 Tax=Streptomyces sp. NBC_01275 TaxID=2903807 RepID=UPI002251D186|nr:SSI family serine proteinase inhibitor [Streptomyces sp. NBC_01275]MCX4765715.1 subtilase-type protease inhibitor [Streptomyces sp. NBC_01275]